MDASRFVTLVLGLWLLPACGPVTIRDSATESYVPLENRVLELHRDVTIPPNQTRAFFQNGEPVRAVNEYAPHCQLRVREISTQAQTVHAGRFRVERVFGTEDSIVSNGRLRFAAAGAVTLASGNGGGNGPLRLMYFYFMELQADEQPNVTYLVCGGQLNDPAFARYPTLQDIRTALGDYATLE